MHIHSVTEITRYLKQLFERDAVLSTLYVRGEISNFKKHHSGHCYFTIKDSGAAIRAVMFKSRAQFLRFQPTDGMKVVAGGQIAVFERDGQYQLYVEQLLPDGIGELSLAYSQLKEKLEAEGLFAQARKRPLPLLPQRVGLITSPTGAALRDMITVAKRRFPAIPLVLYPVQVQGPDAPRQIVQALAAFNRYKKADVLIAGRGGGSIEELWAFNDEEVVRAIAASAIPVVSAVGHETDYTLADFAADRRAATPSQAAELVVPDVAELKRYIRNRQAGLDVYIRNLLKRQRLQVEKQLQQALFKEPEQLLAGRRQLLDGLTARLEAVVKEQLTSRKQALSLAAQKLALLDPLAVLARGYSITRTEAGRVVKQTQDTQPGAQLTVLLADGALDVRVISIEKGALKHAEKKESN